MENYRFFALMDDPGYCEIDEKGICGYIAAAMLLTYQQVTYGGNIVDSNYYDGNSLNGYSIEYTLPKALYWIGVNLGYGTNTTSVEVHYTVKRYLEIKNVAATHTSLYIPFANNSLIESKIQDDRPVIWFGNIAENSFDNQRNINHAVLIYGVKSSLLSGDSCIAHFGWDDASMVSFTGILGSMYTFEVD